MFQVLYYREDGSYLETIRATWADVYARRPSWAVRIDVALPIV